MANARDGASTSTATQLPPGSTAGSSGGSMVASWFHAHPKIDNAAFEGLRKLQAPQRDEILHAIQQQYGNAFVQAGLAGKLPDSESAAADRDFANAHGNTATLAADLGSSRATDAYDTELMTRMTTSQQSAVVNASPEVATRAVLDAEIAGVIDANDVIARGNAGGAWHTVAVASEGQAQGAVNTEQHKFDIAKDAYNAANQRLMVELYQLSPTMTRAQQLKYQQQFVLRNKPIYDTYKAAASELAAVMTKYQNPMSAAARLGDDTATGRNAMYSQATLYQDLVDSGSPQGAVAALEWAMSLGLSVKTSPAAAAELAQLQEQHPQLMKNLIGPALANAATPTLAAQVQRKGPKGLPGPSLRAQWETFNATYLTPMSDLAQIYALGDLRGVVDEIDEASKLWAAQYDGDAKKVETLLAAREKEKLAQLMETTPVASRLLRLFVDSYGVAGVLDGGASGQIGAALIAFASNGGKMGLEDAVSHFRSVASMVESVRDPSLLSKLVPGISVAANSMQLALDTQSQDLPPIKVVRLLGDVVAIVGSLMEFIPGGGQPLGEAVEGIGLAISALADLGDWALNLIHAQGPSTVQTDERALMASRGTTFTQATTADPGRAGKNLRALGAVLSPEELTQLVDARPDLFQSTDISADIVTANVKVLHAAGVSVSQIQALALAAPEVLTQAGGARNIAIMLPYASIEQIGLLINAAPELVGANGVTIEPADVAANLKLLHEAHVDPNLFPSLIKSVPMLVVRPHAMLGSFYLWLALYQGMIHLRMPTFTFFQMVEAVANWQLSELDAGIAWALANGAPNISPQAAIDHFYRQIYYAPLGDYHPGEWLESGLFPKVPPPRTMSS
jgi:hypothetical protein